MFNVLYIGAIFFVLSWPIIALRNIYFKRYRTQRAVRALCGCSLLFSMNSIYESDKLIRSEVNISLCQLNEEIFDCATRSRFWYTLNFTTRIQWNLTMNMSHLIDMSVGGGIPESGIWTALSVTFSYLRSPIARENAWSASATIAIRSEFLQNISNCHLDHWISGNPFYKKYVTIAQ